MAKAKRVSKKGNVYLYVYVTKDQKLGLGKVAKKKGTTLSALTRNILEDFLETNAS